MPRTVRVKKGWSFLKPKERVQWVEMRKQIEECWDTWGALHSRNCLAGTGFEPAASQDYYDKFVEGFQAIYRHPKFSKACTKIEAGIASHADYNEIYGYFEAINADVPGAYPKYHFKLALDHLVESGFIPRAYVCKWPVAPTGGTAKGLRSLFFRSRSPTSHLPARTGTGVTQMTFSAEAGAPRS